MNAEQKIKDLNLELPPAPKPVAVYKPLVVVDRMAYVSGHGPLRPDKSLITGRVGADLSLEQGKAAARQVGLAIISTLKDQGVLHRVREGETLIITEQDQPVAEIRPIERVRRPRPFGLARGTFVVPDDFDDPITKAIDRACDRGNDPRDEFSVEAGRRILENTEW